MGMSFAEGIKVAKEIAELHGSKSKRKRKKVEQPLSEPLPDNEFTRAIKEAKEIASRHANHGKPVHKKDRADKWTDAQKMAACPRNAGRGYGVRGTKASEITKDAFGQSDKTPHYCNMCPGCYKAHAKELKERMEGFDNKCKSTVENGHWRKKVVDDDKEAKALKKQVSRKQGGRHVEFACDAPDQNEIWTYVEDGTENPEYYGEQDNPTEDIDFDKVYENNRSTGKKFSSGKAFRSSAPAPKQDTERIIIPGILVDQNDADKAAKIVQNTNYIEEAKDFKNAIELYAYQFKFILKELEKEGIEVIAVNHNYRNVVPEKFLQDWNEGRKYWMSIYAPHGLNGSGANMDKPNRLYFPDNKKEALTEPLVEKIN